MNNKNTYLLISYFSFFARGRIENLRNQVLNLLITTINKHETHYIPSYYTNQLSLFYYLTRETEGHRNLHLQ